MVNQFKATVQPLSMLSPLRNGLLGSAGPPAAVQNGEAVLWRGRAGLAMHRSLQIAPDHRLILRAACRRLIHVGDVQATHALIARHARTREDPWLIAAELAVAQILECSPKYLKEGTNLFKSQRYSPAATTELGAALCMQAYASGATKLAKRLLRKSLEAPTDNLVAQARWIGTRLGGIEISSAVWNTPRSYEAWTWRAFVASDWSSALRFARAWVLDEPFSSRAATHATYMARSVNRDYEYAIACAQQVLVADPNDLMLTNNLVVALAYQGDLEKAANLCNRLMSAPDAGDAGCTFAATRGLVAFRAGDVEAGRNFYAEAFRNASRSLKLRVLAHWLREEARVDPRQVLPIMDRLMKFAGTRQDSVVQRILEIARDDGLESARRESSVIKHGGPDAVDKLAHSLENDLLPGNAHPAIAL